MPQLFTFNILLFNTVSCFSGENLGVELRSPPSLRPRLQHFCARKEGKRLLRTGRLAKLNRPITICSCSTLDSNIGIRIVCVFVVQRDVSTSQQNGLQDRALTADAASLLAPPCIRTYGGSSSRLPGVGMPTVRGHTRTCLRDSTPTRMGRWTLRNCEQASKRWVYSAKALHRYTRS